VPFKKYKAEHGGRGPLEDAYAAVTGGQGLFGRLGMHHERELTDQLIADVENSDEFKGLDGMLEAGRSPMTREQHAGFRSGVIQAALNQRVFNAGYEDYLKQSGGLRATAKSRDDLALLDDMDAQAKHAQRLMQSGDPAMVEKGTALFGSVLQSRTQYVRTNEEQAIELQSSEDAERETIRGEIQGEVNSKIVDPIRQDTANYAAIQAQLEGPDGAEIAPPSLVSTVLEYAGAQLRQSDDGNWSFAIGPLGISDTNLPAMTYSQIRNRLEQAFQGRDKFMRAQLAQIGAEAQKRGFGINGPRVSDLMFPLADAAYAAQERETKPPPPKPEDVQAKAAQAAETVTNVLAGVGRGVAPSVVDFTSRALSRLFGPSEDVEQPEQETAPMQFEGLPVDAQGEARGVYIPRFLRRPVND